MPSPSLLFSRKEQSPQIRPRHAACTFVNNLLTGTLQAEIEEFARFLDTQFTHIPAITEVPMYRRVVIEQLKVLGEFADEMVEVLCQYDGTEETYEVPTGRKKLKSDMQ